MDSDVKATRPLGPRLGELVTLFHDHPDALAAFERVSADQCPEVYRELLAHSAHMTVAVEQHHGELVDVQVLQESRSGQYYQREILLRRSSDQRVVQFGIVRLDLAALPPPVSAQILSRQLPLGRILIDNAVLREVQLATLWKVTCGPLLADYFGVPDGRGTFGRTARIIVDSTPTIDLLEIVAPESEAADCS